MDERICAACGAPNPVHHQFCGGCGSALVNACPACAAIPSTAEQRFCGSCGAALAGDGRPGAAAVGHDAELRRVSVLFVDLVGWTALSEERAPEDLRNLLSGYFDLARTVVERYGGEIEKFIGDAVMAVWGARTALEDDAERAVRAAIDLVESIPAYGERAAAPLLARAGVVTGQVAAVDNRSEGIVVGDRVNTAARVQAAAEPGQVLVDDVTRQLTDSAVSFDDAGSYLAKGKAQPMQLWRAMHIVARVGGRARVDGLATGLVGRSRELALVKQLFHATADDRRARMLLVTGIAGVGKSRVQWELSTYIDGVVGTTYWHLGRCLAYGEDVSVWALAEMIRDRFGIEPDASADTVAERISNALPEWVSSADERDFLAPRLAALLGRSHEAFGRQDLFGAWRLFFVRLSERNPVIMVFEDVQWADTVLVDFIEHLLDYAAESRIFLLALARPELAERRPGWLGGRHDVTTLPLEPLPAAAMDELVAELVPGLPDDVRHRVVTKAEGIPLYAVETVRSLLDRGALVASEGRYALVGDLDELEAVPAGLTGLIAARLDALPTPERALVQDLSVLGQSFPRTAVSQATDLAEEALDDLLRSLVRKQVLTVRDDPLSMSRGDFMFVQSMLRSVAYETLSRRDRRSRHLRLAEHLDARGEDTAELAAAHYHEAFLADPQAADADQTRHRGMRAFERAGRRARSVGASDAAAHAYETASSLAADELDRMRLESEAATMHRLAGRPDQALATFDRLVAEHEAAGREDLALEASFEATRCLMQLSRLREVSDRARNRLAHLDPDREDSVVARLENSLGVSLYWQGREAEAVPHLERALTLAAAYELPEVQGWAGSIWALTLAGRGRYGEARAIHRWALELLQGENDLTAQTNVQINLAEDLVEGDEPGADQATAKVLELSRRLGDRNGEAFGLVNHALVMILNGRWDEAAELSRAVLGLSHDPIRASWAQGRMMLVHLWRGEDAKALTAADSATELQHSEDMQDRPAGGSALAVAQWLRADPAATTTALDAAREAATAMGLRTDILRVAWMVTAHISVASGRDDAVAELVDLIASHPPGHVPPFLRAEVARLRAGLLTRTGGDLDEVEEGLRVAVATMEDLGYPYWQALANLDLGRFLLDQGRADDAEKPLVLAVEAFESLGALPGLEQASTALAATAD